MFSSRSRKLPLWALLRPFPVLSVLQMSRSNLDDVKNGDEVKSFFNQKPFKTGSVLTDRTSEFLAKYCSIKQIKQYEETLTDQQFDVLDKISSDDRDLGPKYKFDNVWFYSPIKIRYEDKPDNVLIWKNYPELTHLMATHMQKLGSCHAVAASQLQHMVVTINRFRLGLETDPNVGMIDATSIVRHHIKDCSNLDDYLKGKEAGGSSIGDLKMICGLKEKDLLKICPSMFPAQEKKIDVCEFMMSKLKDYPALVAEFNVNAILDFMVDTSDEMSCYKISFCETDIMPVDEDLSKHAMLLVGMRKEDGEYYFLLQNSWLQKPFIEVTYEVLIAAGATVVFIKKEITDISPGYDLKIVFKESLETYVDGSDSKVMSLEK